MSEEQINWGQMRTSKGGCAARWRGYDQAWDTAYRLVDKGWKRESVGGKDIRKLDIWLCPAIRTK